VKDVRDAEAKEAMLRQAEAAVAVVLVLGDLTVGMALSKNAEVDIARLQKAAEVLVSASIGDAREQSLWELRALARGTLNEGKPAGLPERRPFHWPLEFPEVIGGERGFDAFVGNPPFMRGHDISGRFGDDYREWLADVVYGGKAGLADLCAFFMARATALLPGRGSLGFVATNSISEGDTRRVGLDYLQLHGTAIVRAWPDLPWPGNASVVISPVVLFRGGWHGSSFLGDMRCDEISSGLVVGSAPSPKALDKNLARCFVGSYVLGDGFILSVDEAEAILGAHPTSNCAEVVLPYMNGVELNSFPDLLPRRRIISFWDWPLEKAALYPACLDRVRALVKPIRDHVDRDRRRRLWWQYGEVVPGLYHALGLGGNFQAHPDGWTADGPAPTTVIAKAKTSETWAFARVSARTVFDQAITVVVSDSYEDFALLQSRVHEVWARGSGSGSKMKTDLRYAPTTFATFPFPEALAGLEGPGRSFYAARQAVMLGRRIGFTSLDHLISDPGERSAEAEGLRQHSIALDRAVAAAYGLSGFDLGHGFHETKQGIRFTIGESARRKVLDRLLELNRESYAEEVKQGFHDKGAKKGSKKRGAGSKGAALLDLGEEE
jgi:hypothetical protein